MEVVENAVVLQAGEENKLMTKMRMRLVPYLFLLFLICMIDRVNIGFAALQMNADLGINSSMFGFIAGLFFLAYFFFEVPSNVLMQKFGARTWITRILVTWGIVVICMGFISSVTQLAIARILLGVAEAGFYPCVILYFTYWFPVRHMARTVALFQCAVVISNLLAAPISTLIMDNVAWLGMAGWRWMFILEGLPAVICGILTPFILVNGPEHAKFLTDTEKNWLINEIKTENELKQAKHEATSIWDGFKNLRVWHLSFCYFGFVVMAYGLSFWLPQIIKGLAQTLTNTQIGFIAAIPFLFAAVFMIANGRHSDKTGERRYHAGIPLFLTGLGFVILTFTHDLVMSILIICIITGFNYSFVGCFWAIPNAILSKKTAAVGLAIINSVGNLGGFVGPFGVGMIKEATGSMSACMYFLATVGVLVTILILAIPKKETVIKAEN